MDSRIINLYTLRNEKLRDVQEIFTVFISMYVQDASEMLDLTSGVSFQTKIKKKKSLMSILVREQFSRYSPTFG